MASMNAPKRTFSEFSPTLPWTTRISLTLFETVTDLSRRSNGTVRRCFLRLFDPITEVPPRTRKGVKASDVTVDTKRNLWFRLFVPTQTLSDDTKLPVIIYFHGGGFVFLSPDTRQFDTLCRKLALKTPAVVVSVAYGLAPENRAPTQYEQGYEVVKFLDTSGCFPPHADLSRCFLAGDSGGANIAHNVARLVAEAESKAELSNIKVRGMIALQPAFNGEERTESQIRLNDAPFLSIEQTDWYFRAFLPPGEDRDNPAVNVFGPRSDDISGLDNFPPTLLVIGDMDPLQDWQRRYYEGLRRNGKQVKLVEYANAFHTFYIFPEVPEAAMVIMEIGDFIHNNGVSTV